jgi:hypothetical protein
MARNYLVFIFGLFLLLVFSFFFCYVAIYNENLPAGIAALVGFVASLIIAILIGVSSRDEGGILYIWFFTIAGVTAIILVWFLSRGGVVLKIW